MRADAHAHHADLIQALRLTARRELPPVAGGWSDSSPTDSSQSTTSPPPMRSVAVGRGPSGLALARGTLWVTLGYENTLRRLNPRTGLPVGAPIATGGWPAGSS